MAKKPELEITEEKLLTTVAELKKLITYLRVRGAGRAVTMSDLQLSYRTPEDALLVFANTLRDVAKQLEHIAKAGKD